MREKVSAPISKITVSSPVFSREVFSPTLINYFYGRNGAGKSTIAKQIGKFEATEWTPGAVPRDYELLVYNEEFIQENIQSYGSIPGVFTITKQNADIKAAVDKKTAEFQEAANKKAEIVHAVTAAQNRLSKLMSNLINTAWSKTETLRKAYPETQTGFTRDKSKFTKRLIKQTAAPVDENAIRALYAVAYGKGAVRYRELEAVSATTLPSSPLTEKPIISSGHTAFADFLSALGATAWVSQGHRNYQHIAGDRCPYCQRQLPENFESDLASCFNEQYNHELGQLKNFIRSYRDTMNNLYSIMASNIKIGYACDELMVYSVKFELFMEKVKANISQLEKKENDPAIVISLDNLSGILQELDNLAEKINLKIRQNNAVLDDKPTKQSECAGMVWSLMADRCQTEITVYRSEKAKTEAELSRLGAAEETMKKLLYTLGDEITRLNKQTVNTTAAQNSINALIRSSGFQGFSLIEKPGTQYVYQLVRDDKTVAKGLSEGERHFIAFLYFYHMVMGSQSNEGERKDKIVIIDDPVSSMDSGALFTVATLVREMIAVCYNNYEMTETEGTDDHIRQIFCLTHNPFFFKEIIYNRLSAYECVSVYEIKKQEKNRSIIEQCEQDSHRIGDGKVNRSPVVNTYEALWREYQDSNDSIALMNVTRRILEYYFLQMCGYSNGNIRSDLLEKHRPDFETLRSDGSVNLEKYEVVKAMIASFDVGALAFNDGLYFDASAVDPALLKEAFRQVFDVLGQIQHYKMMMQEN